MPQRYGRAIRVTLITLGATFLVSGLQLSFIHLPPPIALAWQIVLTVVVGTLWIRWQRVEWHRALPRRASAWRAVALAVVICLSVAAAYHTAVEPTIAPNLRLVGDTIGKRAALVLTALLTGPLLEEALFRGYMLGRLRRDFSATTSVLLAATLFAAAHGDPSRILPQLVAGLVFGILVVHTGRLWLAAVAHGLGNASALVEHFIFTTGIPSRLGVGFPLLCLVVAVAAAVELHRVLTKTRWSVPLAPTVRVAPPLTWGINVMS
jgi:membrane protease YdiL (CAAX protease family)